MGVGLVRSLQPPDILWIHWRVYNFIANTSKGVLFLPPSNAYVRSFLYFLYTLIKLYYTKALSNQASFLAPDWILLLRGPRIPVSSCDSTTAFQWPAVYGVAQSWTRLKRLSSSSSPLQWASQVVLVIKNLPANAGDLRDGGLIPGLGRCPGGGRGNPLQ